MRPTTDRWGVRAVRTWTLLGTASLLLMVLSPVMLPAAIVALATAIAGLRAVGRDADAASMRLGMSLLVVGLVGGTSMLAGGLVQAASTVPAIGCFYAAWRGCEALKAAERLRWGVEHRARLERLRGLHERRDALRDRLS